MIPMFYYFIYIRISFYSYFDIFHFSIISSSKKCSFPGTIKHCGLSFIFSFNKSLAFPDFIMFFPPIWQQTTHNFSRLKIFSFFLSSKYNRYSIASLKLKSKSNKNNVCISLFLFNTSYGVSIFLFSFGIEAIFPKLYNINPVSPIAVNIEEPWIASTLIFLLIASNIKAECVVAEKTSPIINNPISDFFASFINFNDSTSSLFNSMIFFLNVFSSSLLLDPKKLVYLSM